MSKGVKYVSGKYITVVSRYGHIIRSENYGVAGSWKTFEFPIDKPCYSVSMSDNGRYQVFFADGYVVLSENYGKEGSWNYVFGPISDVGYYGGMNDTGNIMFAINSDVTEIYRSFDMGNNWKTSGTHIVETISVNKPSIPIVWETE